MDGANGPGVLQSRENHAAERPGVAARCHVREHHRVSARIERIPAGLDRSAGWRVALEKMAIK
jgi:hypothetical protein